MNPICDKEIKANSWQEYLQIVLLQKLVPTGQYVSVLKRFLNIDNMYIVVKQKFDHWFTLVEVEEILRQLHREGLIEVRDYRCECCREAVLTPENVLTHVTGFRLTAAGRACLAKLAEVGEEKSAEK